MKELRFLKMAFQEQALHGWTLLTFLTCVLHPSSSPLILNYLEFTKQFADSRLSAFEHAIPSAEVLSPTHVIHVENCCLSSKKWSKDLLLCETFPDLLRQSWLPSLSVFFKPLYLVCILLLLLCY